MVSPVSGLISPTLPPIMNPLRPTVDSTFPSPSKGSYVYNSLYPNEGPYEGKHIIPPLSQSSLALTQYYLVRLRSMHSLSLLYHDHAELSHFLFVNAAMHIPLVVLISVTVGRIPSTSL
jgi:hypothetical protein